MRWRGRRVRICELLSWTSRITHSKIIQDSLRELAWRRPREKLKGLRQRLDELQTFGKTFGELQSNLIFIIQYIRGIHCETVGLSLGLMAEQVARQR